MAVASGFPYTGNWATRTRDNGDPAVIGNWMNRRRSDSTELANAVLESLDWLNLGVILTDASGQLLLANRPAEQLLANRDGLEEMPGGTIGTVNQLSSRPLRAAFQQAAQGVGAEAAFCSRALMVPRQSGKRPLTLFVRPVVGRSASGSSIRSVLTFILDPESPISTSEATLRRMYGFTSAEARLAKLLISGNNFENCCLDLDIRPSTARMHLGNMYAKTGVQRQGQLIAVLLKSVGMVRMSNSDATNQGNKRQGVGGKESRVKCCADDVLSGGLEALDSLYIGVTAINGSREVLFANDTANQIMAAGDGLDLTAQGLMSTSKRNLIPLLGSSTRTQPALGFAAQTSTSDSVVALPRSGGRRPLTLFFKSFADSKQSTNPRNPTVLVFMLDPEFPLPPVESGLRELYRFTSCEARLAHLLIEGHALEDCCEQLGIRPSTARMHLASMFGKVGVQRQGSLISLLLKSVCMVRIGQTERTMQHRHVRMPHTSNRIPAVGS